MATNNSTTRPSLTMDLATRYAKSDVSAVPKAVVISSPYATGFVMNAIQGQTNFNLNATPPFAPTGNDLTVYGQANVS